MPKLQREMENYAEMTNDVVRKEAETKEREEEEARREYERELEETAKKEEKRRKEEEEKRKKEEEKRRKEQEAKEKKETETRSKKEDEERRRKEDEQRRKETEKKQEIEKTIQDVEKVSEEKAKEKTKVERKESEQLGKFKRDDPRYEKFMDAIGKYEATMNKYRESNKPLTEKDYKTIKDAHNELARETVKFAQTMTPEERTPDTVRTMKLIQAEIRQGVEDVKTFDPKNPKSFNELHNEAKIHQKAVSQNNRQAGNFLTEMEKPNVRSTTDQFSALKDKLQDYKDYTNQNEGKAFGGAEMLNHDKMLEEIGDFSKKYMEEMERKGALTEKEQQQLNIVSQIYDFSQENQYGNMNTGEDKENLKEQDRARKFAMYDDFNKDKERAAEFQKQLAEDRQKDERLIAKAMADPKKALDPETKKAMADFYAAKTLDMDLFMKDGQVNLDKLEKSEKALKDGTLSKEIMEDPKFNELCDKLNKDPQAREKFKEEVEKQKKKDDKTLSKDKSREKEQPEKTIEQKQPAGPALG